MSEPSLLDELPGELMMWVLIVSELLVFSAGLTAFMAVRLNDVQGFAEAQSLLNRPLAGLNTMVLVTSGFLAALGVRTIEDGALAKARMLFLLAGALGVVFLAIKVREYATDFAHGVGPDTHPFFMFYFLLTGFHAAHVAAGVLILGWLAARPRARAAEAGVAFWHMVDLVWVLLFPVVYAL
jgi:nitric oxide reductase NorE protein